jgi:hypothetical protein
MLIESSGGIYLLAWKGSDVKMDLADAWTGFI